MQHAPPPGYAELNTVKLLPFTASKSGPEIESVLRASGELERRTTTMPPALLTLELSNERSSPTLLLLSSELSRIATKPGKLEAGSPLCMVLLVELRRIPSARVMVAAFCKCTK